MRSDQRLGMARFNLYNFLPLSKERKVNDKSQNHQLNNLLG